MRAASILLALAACLHGCASPGDAARPGRPAPPARAASADEMLVDRWIERSCLVDPVEMNREFIDRAMVMEGRLVEELLQGPSPDELARIRSRTIEDLLACQRAAQLGRGPVFLGAQFKLLMLMDAEEEADRTADDYRHNREHAILRGLGYVGTERAIPPLRAYLERQTDRDLRADAILAIRRIERRRS